LMGRGTGGPAYVPGDQVCGANSLNGSERSTVNAARASDGTDAAVLVGRRVGADAVSAGAVVGPGWHEARTARMRSAPNAKRMSFGMLGSPRAEEDFDRAPKG